MHLPQQTFYTLQEPDAKDIWEGNVTTQLAACKQGCTTKFFHSVSNRNFITFARYNRHRSLSVERILSSDG